MNFIDVCDLGQIWRCWPHGRDGYLKYQIDYWEDKKSYLAWKLEQNLDNPIMTVCLGWFPTLEKAKQACSGDYLYQDE